MLGKLKKHYEGQPARNGMVWHYQTYQTPEGTVKGYWTTMVKESGTMEFQHLKHPLKEVSNYFDGTPNRPEKE